MALSRLVSFNQQESNMQRALLNRATMRVADTTEISGRVTADSIKHELYAKKQSSLWRLTIFGFCKVWSLVAATLILPSLTYADNNRGDDHGDDLFSNNGLSYLITITNLPPGTVIRGVLTFHADHTMSAILSAQEGGPVQFSSQLGSWKFGNAGGLVARTIWFAFPNPLASPPVDARVTRLDYTATFEWNRTTVKGTFTITDFPLDGDPLDGGGMVVGTFTFTGTLVTP
jgi:hypothetical protein